MTDFIFKAPTLFDPTAIPDDSLCSELHDAPGMAKHLATIQKFAVWLMAEMDEEKLSVGGPFADESGWVFQAPSNEGFVVCIVSGPNGDKTHFHMSISEHSGATREVRDAVEIILRNSGKISDLKLEQ